MEDLTTDTFAERAAQRYAWVQERFAAGNSIVVASYGRATRYKPKHADMIRLRGGRLEAQNGKRWLDISGCKLISE